MVSSIVGCGIDCDCGDFSVDYLVSIDDDGICECSVFSIIGVRICDGGVS